LEGDKVARTILEGQREELIRLAEALLEYETLNFEEVGLLMKGEKIQRDVGPETSDQPEPIPEEKEKEEETGQAIPSLVNPDDSPAPA
jgi:cell division protease FtsH